MSCDYSKPHQETLKTGYTSLLCVKKDGKFGFVNELGEEVIPCKFDEVSYFSEGWAALKKGKKWAYYDAHGRKVLDLKKRFTYCGPFHDGVAFVSTLPTKDAPHNYAAFYEDLCKELQFINTKGEVVFNIKDQWGVVKCSQVVKLGFSEGLLKLRSDSSDQTMIGFLDKSGQLEIPFTSQNQSSISGTFSNGLVVAGKKSDDPSEKNRKYYGYMDKSGEWVIPPK